MHFLKAMRQIEVYLGVKAQMKNLRIQSWAMDLRN